MTAPTRPEFTALDLDSLAGAGGRVVVLLPEAGTLDRGARRINRLTRGALERFAASETFAGMKPGDAHDLAWPAGMQAEAVQVVRLERRAGSDDAMVAGAEIGKAGRGKEVTVIAGAQRHADALALGAMLMGYAFKTHKTGEAAKDAPQSLRFLVSRPDDFTDVPERLMGVAEGVFLTRDLVNEPSNILTTEEFAARAAALSGLGLAVRVLEEDEMAALGMNALLGVGQGSDSPSKLVVLEWKGGEEGAPPLALVGKGVVFDTGGISIKPAAGMEDMTMDMGGAGTVLGVMKTLALRKAKANVVGLLGLVENMPSGNAQRPGDVVRSMKGDTIEVINTDAEGRLVLADVLWFAQQEYQPAGIIDLATLTGAIIIGLGHEKAGVFSNDDAFSKSLLRAAEQEGEGAWPMPLAPAYDKALESRIADLKNTGGRPAGSITAAQFLQRFVKPDVPWIHLDIAGVALRKDDSAVAPKGATGWGVRTLDRMIRNAYES